MAYGVLFSKSGQVLVESGSANPAGDSDATLDRFRTMWGPMWVPGRLTLTKLHLNFIPHRAGRGMAMLDVNLRDVTDVRPGGTRLPRVLQLTTAGHTVQVRCFGSAQLAEQISQRVEVLKHTPVFRPH